MRVATISQGIYMTRSEILERVNAAEIAYKLVYGQATTAGGYLKMNKETAETLFAEFKSGLRMWSAQGKTNYSWKGIPIYLRVGMNYGEVELVRPDEL